MQSEPQTTPETTDFETHPPSRNTNPHAPLAQNGVPPQNNPTLEQIDAHADRIDASVRENLADTTASCSICLEILVGEQDELCRPNGCEHLFHAACLRKWATVRCACPLDKKRFSALVLVDSQTGDETGRESVSEPVEKSVVDALDALSHRDVLEEVLSLRAAARSSRVFNRDGRRAYMSVADERSARAIDLILGELTDVQSRLEELAPFDVHSLLSQLHDINDRIIDVQSGKYGVRALELESALRSSGTKRLGADDWAECEHEYDEEYDENEGGWYDEDYYYYDDSALY